MGFRDIALPLAAKGVPCTPVLPNSKRAFMADWPTSATTDPQKIEAWDKQYPDYNGAAVATGKLGGVWFFEVDSPDVQKRIQEETGKVIPDTFRVRSRPGRGHFYWKQTPASIAMGNISQSYVKNGDWSARVENQYVVAPGSIHPFSQQPYIPLREEPIIEAPEWLIEWMISQKVAKTNEGTSDIPKDPHGLIPHGYIHGWMLTQAGKLRSLGLDVEMIEAALLRLVHENCAPPIDESRVKAMARSVCIYPPGRPNEIILTQTQARIEKKKEEPVPAPVFDFEPYPIFPHFVMEGTSTYEHFIKPLCEKNERIDYFMWLPAMTILLNYVTGKVNIPGLGEKFKGSIYSVIIGQKGKTHKSASIRDCMEYFNYAGVAQQSSRDMKNAEGKTVVWTIGSPEGLGLNMQKTNCKNALLFYDELSKLVGKASIESSSLASDLLTMYESGKFENSIKSTKETFSLAPDTYCTSLIACTTDKKFATLWSKLAGADTGLDDRFFFILEPQELPPSKLKQTVLWQPGSIETKKLIDKAINQKDFSFDDSSPLNSLNAIDPRYANRAEKWALAIAIDLGLDSIDDECVERGIEIVKYERKVKRFMRVFEATTREGELQQQMTRQLEINQGKLSKRELMRKLNYRQHGTSLWNQCYKGLMQNGTIREIGEGVAGDPIMVQLLEKQEEDE